MTKRVLLTLGIFFVTVAAAFAQPKYVFFFIGDGMGVNQVHLTETYRAALDGELGIKPLAISSFPVATMATHYSASSDVTDSAASGTALATGVKTANGRLGVNVDNTEKLANMAEMAKRCGRKVAVLSTCYANHATPGAFEAHQENRHMYYEIMQDMIANGFDFYGGGGLFDEDKLRDGTKMEPIRPQFEAAGYTICSATNYRDCRDKAEKILMLPGEGEAVTYRIEREANAPERKKDHVLLKDMVGSAVDFLMRDGGKKGFFMMAEGGMIDYACHSNDAASVIQEVIDFDEAVQVAVEFYKKYPKQTLIVVTADHETGGLTLNPKVADKLALLRHQTHSENRITTMLQERIDAAGGKLSWEQVKEFLGEQLGLWTEVPMKWADEKALRDIYESTIAKRKSESVKDLYSTNSKLVSAAVEILNDKAGVHWSTGGHSSGYVPVYVMGNGAGQFTHRTDNAEIARTVIKVARYK